MLWAHESVILSLIENGTKIGLGGYFCIPGGGGKTFSAIKFAQIAHSLKILIIERGEGVSDATSIADSIGIKVGVIRGKNWDISSRVIVASDATLLSEKNQCKLLLLMSSINCVFVDDAHHALEAGRLKNFIIENSKNTLFFGLSGSVFGKDKDELSNLFGKNLFSISIDDLIIGGYLSPIISERFNVISGGEKEIVSLWASTAQQRKSLFFCSSVAQAKRISIEIASRGFVCKHINSKTKQRERSEIISEFKRGDLNPLLCVGLLSEGFNDPSCDCIVMVAPTRSKTLYSRRLERGMRLSAEHQEKKNCLVIDFFLPTRTKQRHIKSQISADDFVSKGELKSTKKEIKSSKITRLDGNLFISCGANYIIACARKIQDVFYIVEVISNPPFLPYKILESTTRVSSVYVEEILLSKWEKYSDDISRRLVNTNEECSIVQVNFLKFLSNKLGLTIPQPSSKLEASNLISYILLVEKDSANRIDYFLKNKDGSVYSIEEILHQMRGRDVVFCDKQMRLIFQTLSYYFFSKNRIFAKEEEEKEGFTIGNFFIKKSPKNVLYLNSVIDFCKRWNGN